MCCYDSYWEIVALLVTVNINHQVSGEPHLKKVDTDILHDAHIAYRVRVERSRRHIAHTIFTGGGKSRYVVIK